MSIQCRLCGSEQTDVIGEIFHPEDARVAGIPIDLSGWSFQLIACRNCGFQFKHPGLNNDDLLACYREADAAHWEEDPDPIVRQFDLIAEKAERYSPGRRILDVGCFNGALLHYLDEDWVKFGVEPSEQASRVAAERGVQMLGASIEEVEGDFRAHCITAIDVFEHIVHPLEFARDMKQLLVPGGLLIISTGDSESEPFRKSANRHWYVSLPEHVGFFNRKSVDYFCATFGFSILSYDSISHVRTRLSQQIVERARNFLYRRVVDLDGLKIPYLKKKVVSRRAPVWISARDHMLVVLKNDG